MGQINIVIIEKRLSKEAHNNKPWWFIDYWYLYIKEKCSNIWQTFKMWPTDTNTKMIMAMHATIQLI